MNKKVVKEIRYTNTNIEIQHEIPARRLEVPEVIHAYTPQFEDVPEMT